MTTEFIKGADVSSLLEVEECGGKFYDGEKEDGAMEILRRHGVNLFRLRLWNDPYAEDGTPYGAGTCDLARMSVLARRAKALGAAFMLDFHYSDFWADPGKQTTPKAWRSFDADELCRAVYDFTRDALEKLGALGLMPEYVAVGNEITNGLLWEHGRTPNFYNIARYVGAGIKAARECAPKAKIIVHLDNGGNNALYRSWFDSYFSAGGEDFDVIGLSYYPFWHGKMSALVENMNDIAERYEKELLVVETSMGFSLDDYAANEGLSSFERKGAAANAKLAANVDYPMTKEGQRAFISELSAAIRSISHGRGRGFIWWEPAWIPVRGSQWASPAALAYTGERGSGGNEWANQALFDYDGRALPALYSIKDI